MSFRSCIDWAAGRRKKGKKEEKRISQGSDFWGAERPCCINHFQTWWEVQANSFTLFGYIVLLTFYPSRALRALRLLLADGVPTVGWGKTFWRVDGSLHEHGCNSEMKRRIWMGAMPKRSYERLRTSLWQYLGSDIEKRIFSPLFRTTEKRLLLCDFFFLGPPPLVPIVFFGAPDITIKFSPSWTKINGTSGSRKRALPSGQTGIYWKTKGCLKIWGSPLKAWSACTARSKRGDLFLFIGEPVCTWGGISDTHDIVQTSEVIDSPRSLLLPRLTQFNWFTRASQALYRSQPETTFTF